jgi:hypothetical protein
MGSVDWETEFAMQSERPLARLVERLFVRDEM